MLPILILFETLERFPASGDISPKALDGFQKFKRHLEA